MLLLCNPYGNVYFGRWPHTHMGWIYAGERSRTSTSRPQTPCYSQNDDVTTAISISYLELRTPKTKQAATVQYAFLDNFHLLTSHPYLTINKNKQINLWITDLLAVRLWKNSHVNVRGDNKLDSSEICGERRKSVLNGSHIFNSVDHVNIEPIISREITLITWLLTHESSPETCNKTAEKNLPRTHR